MKTTRGEHQKLHFMRHTDAVSRVKNCKANSLSVTNTGEAARHEIVSQKL